MARKEFIISACNHYDDGKYYKNEPINITKGFVVYGRRHFNCSDTFDRIVGTPYNDAARQLLATEKRGFITSENRFVDRKEAYKIAFEADQIWGPNKGIPENEIGLTSEDLYYETK